MAPTAMRATGVASVGEEPSRARTGSAPGGEGDASDARAAEALLHPIARRRGSSEPSTTAIRASRPAASRPRPCPSCANTTGIASPNRRVLTKIGIGQPRRGSRPAQWAEGAATAAAAAGAGAAAARAKRVRKPVSMHPARRVFAAATVAGAAPKTNAPKPAAARRTAAGKGRRGRSDAESSAALTRFADTIASICATHSSENSAATPLPKHRLEMASTEAPSVSMPSDMQAASTYARPERTR
mmetsp:Transcript_7221/g.23834  ORF Transcript_7221/g.23834 Transcript_7221/m.23834 type:complete len:243 (+) Transcript_7221:695-1423(+)